MRLARYALVTATVAVTGAFFFGRWAINAKALGRHDMGTALFFAHLVPLLLWASLALGAAALAVGAVGLARRRPSWLDLAALVIALLPAGWLFVIDIRAALLR